MSCESSLHLVRRTKSKYTARPGVGLNAKGSTNIHHVNSSSPSALQEAVALADAALALGGHTLHPLTRALITGVYRGELAVEEAIEQILAHHTEYGSR